MDIIQYTSPTGRRPFAEWFDRLNPHAYEKVSDALQRMGEGNLSTSNIKRLGGGIFEYRINYGPGYRIYFGKRGERIIILLGGGTKRGQATDIRRAQRLWKKYLRQMRMGR